MAKVAKRILKTIILLVTGYVTVVAILSAIGPVLTPNHNEDDDLDVWDLFDDEDAERIMNSI